MEADDDQGPQVIGDEGRADPARGAGEPAQLSRDGARAWARPARDAEAVAEALTLPPAVAQAELRLILGRACYVSEDRTVVVAHRLGPPAQEAARLLHEALSPGWVVEVRYSEQVGYLVTAAPVDGDQGPGPRS